MEASCMRSMTVFNYLLEATLFGSILILLVVTARVLLRHRLGSRAIYASWLVVAARLLLPISLPNPLMDEFRPGLSVDVEARPVADQLRRRLIDTGYNVSSILPGDGRDGFAHFAHSTSDGETGKWFLLAWFVMALAVGAWMLYRRSLFTRRVRRNRVRPLDDGEQALYRQLCERYHIKPIAVYYADHLPAGCLAGTLHPFIGLPLDTPKEHLSLLLAHQICHYRAGDPIWGVVRCLCTAVHWFNPVVWMAVWLSYRDSEMACDDRVTARLHDMDRLAYANVIVSEGERENAANMTVSAGASFTDQHLRQRVTAIIRCVRGSRWGIALGSLGAAALLMVSFATGESEPLPTVDDIPTVAWTASAQPIGNDMEAIAAARRFLESEFIAEDTSRYSFIARTDGAQWLVDAQKSDGDGQIALCFSPEGYLKSYDALSLLGDVTWTDHSYTHRRLTDSVQRYVDAFVTALVPGVEYHASEAVADMRSENVRMLLGRLSQSTGDVTAEFILRIEPTPLMVGLRIINE